MGRQARRPFSCRLRRIVHLSVSGGTPLRALKLALVVGSILVGINQWQALVGVAPVDWSKLLLTYCVPYLVSTYTSVAKDLAQGAPGNGDKPLPGSSGCGNGKAAGAKRRPERPT